MAFYEETGRGFELRQVGGGWRYYTREEYADLISRYVVEGQQSKLSQAAWRRWQLSPTPSRSPEGGYWWCGGQRRRSHEDLIGPRTDRGGGP